MEGFIVTWWMWFLFGILLLLLEFAAVGTFYLFFFGLGAVAVGLIAAGINMSFTVEMLLFLVLSLTSLALLRKRLRVKLDSKLPDDNVDRMEGQTAVAMENIAVGAVGKAELRGTAWNARNAGDTDIAESQRCRVERVDGLTLWVRL